MTSVSVFSGCLACDKRERWRTGANATAIRPLSFRGDAKHRTTMRNCASENLEIPRCAVAHLRSGPSDHPGMTPMANLENLHMRVLQPADWSKPRGFSHGVTLDGRGRWIVLAGQTGGDEKGDYQPDMAGQVAPR